MGNLMKSKKGFTLVELIVVIVIIAILAAALVTSLIGYINKASDTNALVEGNNVYVAAQSYLSEEMGSGTLKITDNVMSTDQKAAMATSINTYLGKEGVVEGTDLSSVKVDAKGTITEFVYATTNGRTATYLAVAAGNKPAGWSVA